MTIANFIALRQSSASIEHSYSPQDNFDRTIREYNHFLLKSCLLPKLWLVEECELKLENSEKGNP